MGQLFTRISTESSDQQASTILTQNNLVAIKPLITKRKRIDQDIMLKKRKLFQYGTHSTDRLLLSSKISKPIKSSNFSNTSIISRSFSSMTLFKCQLCYRCFKSKDSYLDHMMTCAIEHQASIKIVRANKKYSIQS